MRNISIIALLAALFGFAGAGEADARGGMGDASASMRAAQALCDAQRRGEYPRYFNACMPDYPVTTYGIDPSTGRPAVVPRGLY